MVRIDYPEPLRHLIAQLKRLPGVGPRSAERMALWLAGGAASGTRGKEIAESLLACAAQVRPCERCGFFAVERLCVICQQESRAAGSLCVVEQATDILPLERTGAFRGCYHVLGGRLAPLDHVGPEDLLIARLVERVAAHPAAEVILALGADVEGEATAQYVASLLREIPGVAITRIAQGLPAGGGLESADELTLLRALSGRVTMGKP